MKDEDAASIDSIKFTPEDYVDCLEQAILEMNEGTDKEPGYFSHNYYTCK